MKQTKEPNWDRVFGEVPASFSARLEDTLDNLKEEKRMNRTTPYRVALIAALIAAITLGTAIAATSGADILNFFRNTNQIEPAEGAESVIQRDLGWLETSKAKLTVREAVYDGAAVRAVLAVEALNKDKYVPVDTYWLRNEASGQSEEEHLRKYAHDTGREILDVGHIELSCVNAQTLMGHEHIAYEGDTMLVYQEWPLTGEWPEELQVCVTLAELTETDENDEKEHSCTFTLGKSAGGE